MSNKWHLIIVVGLLALYNVSANFNPAVAATIGTSTGSRSYTAGDLNLDTTVNITDVQAQVLLALGQDVPAVLVRHRLRDVSVAVPRGMPYQPIQRNGFDRGRFVSRHDGRNMLDYSIDGGQFSAPASVVATTTTVSIGGYSGYLILSAANSPVTFRGIHLPSMDGHDVAIWTYELDEYTALDVFESIRVHDPETDPVALGPRVAGSRFGEAIGDLDLNGGVNVLDVQTSVTIVLGQQDSDDQFEAKLATHMTDTGAVAALLPYIHSVFDVHGTGRQHLGYVHSLALNFSASASSDFDGTSRGLVRTGNSSVSPPARDTVPAVGTRVMLCQVYTPDSAIGQVLTLTASVGVANGYRDVDLSASQYYDASLGGLAFKVMPSGRFEWVFTSNAAPVARDDTFGPITANTSAALAVLGNDLDVDGNMDRSSIRATQQPLNGTLITNSVTGEFIYRSNPGFVGNDRLYYVVSDLLGLVSNEARVDIIIIHAAPVANLDGATTPFGTDVWVSVLLNDTGSYNPGTVDVVSQPVNGTIGGINTLTGAILYRPDPGFSGSDQFQYTVQGPGGTSSPGTVVIMVSPQANQPPVPVDDMTNVFWGQSTPQIDVLATDSDPENDPLSIVRIVTQGQYGSAVINHNNTLTYAAGTGSGAQVDQVVFEVTDGNNPPVQSTLSVLISDPPPVNTPPVAADFHVVMPFNTQTWINIGNHVTDLENNIDFTQVWIIVYPSHGAFNGANTATGAHRYLPVLGYQGPDSFQYQVMDLGGERSNVATVSITVEPPTNYPPVANTNDITVVEGLPFATNLILDDTDPNPGDQLTLVDVELTILGTWGIVNWLANGDFTFTAYHGSSAASPIMTTYVVSDGQETDVGTLNITIVPPANLPPVTTPDARTVVEGGRIRFDPTLNDVDPEGDPLQLMATAVVSGGAFIHHMGIPSGNTVILDVLAGVGNQTIVFTYDVEDGHNPYVRETVTVTVTADPAGAILSLPGDQFIRVDPVAQPYRDPVTNAVVGYTVVIYCNYDWVSPDPSIVAQVAGSTWFNLNCPRIGATWPNPDWNFQIPGNGIGAGHTWGQGILEIPVVSGQYSYLDRALSVRFGYFDSPNPPAWNPPTPQSVYWGADQDPTGNPDSGYLIRISSHTGLVELVQ